MSSLFVVYKITNSIKPTDLYVGSTIKGMEWRKKKHLRDLRKQIHHNRHLQNAVNLYGVDKFIFEIVEELPDATNLLDREEYWRVTLKATYNVVKERMSHIGVKRSEETKRKISQALTGRKLSKQHIEDMRRSLTGRKQPPELAKRRTEHQHKPIVQLTMDGTIVKEWKSATYAEKETNREYIAKQIYRCIWGGYGRKSYKNYRWEYKMTESS